MISFLTKCNQFFCTIPSYFYNAFGHIRWETLLMLETWCSEQLKFEHILSIEWSSNLFEYNVKKENEWLKFKHELRFNWAMYCWIKV